MIQVPPRFVGAGVVRLNSESKPREEQPTVTDDRDATAFQGTLAEETSGKELTANAALYQVFETCPRAPELQSARLKWLTEEEIQDFIVNGSGDILKRVRQQVSFALERCASTDPFVADLEGFPIGLQAIAGVYADIATFYDSCSRIDTRLPKESLERLLAVVDSLIEWERLLWQQVKIWRRYLP